ncbi:methyltransferase domain-containing protein [Terrarubrum flagellatum]|uniref:methyltransferase domain-containing protein n=1 Tax=Terrirubrum flagellatum TaxID=2895980 RepID=UPI003144F32D
MAAVPQIFDRALVRARLARALAHGYEPFLVDRVAGDAIDRLSTVSRTFSHALDLGTPISSFAEALKASGRITHVTRAAPAFAPRREAQDFAEVVANEEAPPFATGAFDLAVSLLALHAINDLPGALSQIRRALKPDGLFLAALFGGATLTELRQALVAAETEIAGGASPRVAPFADVRDLGSLLQRAGFALPVTDIDRATVRYADLFALMRDLRRMGLTNALIERSRKPVTRALLFRAAAIYHERFADPDGRIRATFDLIWLSGWAPHESQQKPLRPGSAKARLADALGAAERSAGEKAG